MEKTPEDSTPVDNVVPIRSTKGQFVKGQSGNATGKSSPTSRRSVKAATDALYSSKAVKVAKLLWEMINDPTTPPTVRFNAIKEFNDRGLGKAKQEIEVTNHEVPSNYDMAAVSSDSLREVIAASRVTKGKK